MQVDANKLDDLRASERSRQQRQQRQQQDDNRRRQERQHQAREEEYAKSRREREQYKSGGGYPGESAKRGWGQKFTKEPGFEEKKRKSPEEVRILSAWRAYQSRWLSMLSPASYAPPLTYELVPWPVTSAPYTVASLTPSRIAAFLLSPLLTPPKTPLERIREAMKLWHPDKWTANYLSECLHRGHSGS